MRKTMKKLLACFTVLTLTMSFAPGALAAPSTGENVTAIVNTRTPITDASFDKYFGDTAAAGVMELLNEGAVYINGRQVPYVQENGEYSSELFLVNGFTALERLKNEDTGAHYWRWDLHASVRGNTNGDTRTEQEQFDAARLAMVEGATKLLGFTTELVGDPVSKIMITVKSSAQVTEVSVNGENAIIKGTEHNNDTRGYGSNLTADTFPVENVTGDIKAGDIVLYWQDERDGNAGWNVERATSTSGYLTGDNDYGDQDELTLDFIFNDKRVPQAVLRRDGLAVPVRPSQFLEEHLKNEKQDYPVLIWTTDTGHIIGISYDVADKTALGDAIKAAQEAMAGIVVSDDGYNVWTTQKWMKEAVLRVMKMMTDGALAVYNNEAATQEEVDAALGQVARVAPAIPYQAADGYRVPLGESKQAEIAAKIFEKSVFESIGTDAAGRTVVGGAVAGNSAADAMTVQNLSNAFVTGAEGVEDLTGLVSVVSGDVAASADTVLGTGMIVEIQTGNDPMEMVVVVKNDLTGDGITDLNDLQAMAKEMQSPGTLSSEQILAAAIPETNENSVLNMLSVLVSLSQTMMGNT